jgi:hypothetical protein
LLASCDGTNVLASCDGTSVLASCDGTSVLASCDGTNVLASCDGTSVLASCDGTDVLASCDGVLASCDGVLASCDGVLASCDGVLASCDGVLASCDGVLAVGIVCGTDPFLRNLMLHARTRGMTGGEYVYITTNLHPSEKRERRWRTGADDDWEAREAYWPLLQVRTWVWLGKIMCG